MYVYGRGIRILKASVRGLHGVRVMSGITFMCTVRWIKINITEVVKGIRNRLCILTRTWRGTIPLIDPSDCVAGKEGTPGTLGRLKGQGRIRSKM